MFANLSCGAIGHAVAYEREIELASANGFAGVDLNVEWALKMGAAATRAAIEGAKLRFGGFGLSVRWRENDSERDFADSLEGFTRACRIAAELGVTRCTTWVMPCSQTLTYRQHVALVVPRLRAAAQILAGFGQRLGLEFIGPRSLRAPAPHAFVHTMDGMRALATAIGGNVGLLLDSWHWHTAQASARDIAQLDPADVVYVHLNDAPKGVGIDELKDNQRELPTATGVIDLAGFFAALRALKYDGPVTIEPFNAALKALPVETAVAATKTALDRAMKAA
ncbi:MAG: sugar phosphate isomerase/epimerase [Planctomycetes bacterium]|nr:sugar phosphate isomerase/epimerase [Planctomycetota bacterium]